MTANYLMYTASGLFFACYLPELYANWKNKNANLYNVPEKIFILLATILALSYSIINKNPELIANYGPLLFFDTLALTMRLYYCYVNNRKITPIQTITIQE
jgi:uncharacterized protein with PQ loop repeat